jgi:hypothetical protein
MESKGNESPVADDKKVQWTWRETLKKMQKQFNEYQENLYKKTWEDTETTKWTQRGFQQTTKWN